VAIGLAVLGRWGRIPIGQLADVIAPAFGFAMSVTRIGCLLAGCCAGKPSDVIWAIRFPAHSLVWGAQVRAGLIGADAATSLPVHPLQIYFGALALGVGIFALWFERRKAYDGQVFLAYVTLYGIGQFLLEFLRFGPLPHVQFMALVLALVAAAVLAVKASAAVPQRSLA
jgi:phosphatidylglycerol:prolipoprotein diacylglycerol transferase